MVHRDSQGIKQVYGDGDVQWMRAGRGTMHEEMWDINRERERFERHELFQLWFNLPRKNKFGSPKISILKEGDQPVVSIGKCEVRVLTGDILVRQNGLSEEIGETTTCGLGKEMQVSPIAVLRAVIPQGEALEFDLPERATSVVAYVREGACIPGQGKEWVEAPVTPGDVVVFRSSYHSSTSEPPPSRASFTVQADETDKRPLDVLLLIGDPIKEKVVWQGPLVHANEEDYARSAQIFNGLGPNAYWDHGTSDAAWRRHVEDLDLQGQIEARLSGDTVL
jgi:redox-sensitive bicupin YhaK (pirin superfamily)